jgi:hypothetical protein
LLRLALKLSGVQGSSGSDRQHAINVKEKEFVSCSAHSGDKPPFVETWRRPVAAGNDVTKT